MPRPRIGAVSSGRDAFSVDDVELVAQSGLCTAISGLSDVAVFRQSGDPEARDFDLYYARSSQDGFAELPSPKVTFAYPYDSAAFDTADAVLTTSEVWEKGLASYNDDPQWRKFFSGHYPERIVPPRRIVNIGQPVGPDFCDHRGSFRHFRYRARFGYGFTVGYLDCISEPPREFMEILPSLEKEVPFLSTVLIGDGQETGTSPSLRVARNISRDDIPFAISACDVIIASESPEANWQSSRSVQQAMACGVPILTERGAARTEQLGDPYPCYYRDSDEMLDLIRELYRRDDFRSHVRDYLLARYSDFEVGVYSDRLAALLEELISRE